MLGGEFDEEMEQSKEGGKRSGPSPAKEVGGQKQRRRQKPKAEPKPFQKAGEESGPRALGSASSGSGGAGGQHLQLAAKEYKQLLPLVIKQLLKVTQNNRDFEGALMDTWLGPKKDVVFTTTTTQNGRYSVAVRDRGHGKGPPHLYTMAGVVGGLAKHRDVEEVEGEDAVLAEGAEEEAKGRDTMKGMLETYSTWTEIQKADFVKFCRVGKVYQEDKMRLTLMMAPTQAAMEARIQIVKILDNRPGWVRKTGRPPAGYMERQLGEWLQHILGE